MSRGEITVARRRVTVLGALLAALTCLGMQLVLPAWADGPVDVYQFDSAQQEERYRALVAEFRCPKCLNTNLAGSDAPIAQDLRRTVHRLVVTEGRTDQEIRDYLQDRYGDFVLYKPPFRPGTWLLWLAPVIFALIGALVLWRLLRQPPAEPLSEQERARLRAIVDDS